MGGLTLLDRARSAGLTVRARGDRLVIDGPRSADGIARELIGRKAEVLAELAGAASWPDLASMRWGQDSGEPERDIFDDRPNLPTGPSPKVVPPAPLPWRPIVAKWPIPLRQRWGDLANELADAGIAWPEDEAEAFRRVSADPALEHLRP